MPKVGVESLFRDPCRVQMLELEATFEAVKSVLMLSFSDDDEVVEAVNIISELLSDALSQRRRATRRLRVTFGAGVAIAAVAITMAVVAVEWF